MQFFLVLFLIAATPCLALQITRQHNEIYLNDLPCEKLAPLLKGLSLWSAKINGTKTCSEEAAKPTENQMCQVEVSQCIPEKLKEYLGKTADKGGPNCFNAALVFSGILSNLRGSTADEIEFYMKEPLCRKKAKSESPEAGDLGLISRGAAHQKPFVSHAFIYLSDDFVFEKSSQFKTDPYTLKERSETIAEYSNLPGILTNVDYYQCISMEKYLSDKNNLPSWLKAANAKIEAFESCFENHVVNAQPLGTMAQKNLLETMASLKAYYVQEDTANKLDAKSKEQMAFMITRLQLKIDSIYFGIDRPSKDPKLTAFSYELKQAYDDLKASQN